MPTTLSRTRAGSSLAKNGKNVAMAVAPFRSTVPLCHHSGRPPHARAPHAGRMTCSGRSPGSRVIVLLRLPGLTHKSPVAFRRRTHRLQLRAQLWIWLTLDLEPYQIPSADRDDRHS